MPGRIGDAVTDADKVAAFDLLAAALTNKWESGQWSWWCCCPCGGEMQNTQAAAVVDLIAWAGRTAKRKQRGVPLVLDVVNS